ncbi:MAG: NAD-dependent protein deacetylase [Gemmatimonadota bacterium]
MNNCPADASPSSRPVFIFSGIMTIVTQLLDRTSLDDLVDLLRASRTVVLAGAGCSTESGIPDYRGPEGSLHERKPIQYQEFVRSESARVRYWTRSMVGWPRMSAARPNRAHQSLARLEQGGTFAGIITQNVDGLHQRAGSRRVVELHGTLGLVRCLGCGRAVDRDEFQHLLLDLNAEWAADLKQRMPTDLIGAAPDGDAELPVHTVNSFRVPGCDRCGEIMKPDVVFFGENVPAPRLAEAWKLFELADVLLVLGSSLTVYSGRRFVYRAQADGVRIGVVNVGPTRADDVAEVKVEARLGSVLPCLAGRLLG